MPNHDNCKDPYGGIEINRCSDCREPLYVVRNLRGLGGYARTPTENEVTLVKLLLTEAEKTVYSTIDMNKDTVEIPRAWFKRLIGLAELCKEQPDRLDMLLAYIYSAEAILQE